MYLRISWGTLKPGTWDDYAATHRRVVPGVGSVDGLRGRMIARDVERADTGYSISLWDSLEAMRAYEDGPLKAVLSELEPYFGGEFATHHCDLGGDDQQAVEYFLHYPHES